MPKTADKKLIRDERAVDRFDAAQYALKKTPTSALFPENLKLVPQLNEVYELYLAYYESLTLSSEEILRNGAYFAEVGGHPTRHYLMCEGEPVRLAEHSSSRLKSFFKTNQFKTGYATHGLFPYRGKFHPQMIKALLNIMGLRPGDTVLDPMMGSGTVNIEATLMGINSVGIDASPFCRFMAQVKVCGLTLPLAPVRDALKVVDEIFDDYSKVAPPPATTDSKSELWAAPSLFSEGQLAPPMKRRDTPPSLLGNEHVRDFVTLAYLDAMGYATRSHRKTPIEQFRAIFERYYFVAEKIQKVLEGTEHELGHTDIREGDARSLPLDDVSVDGILFSPPYSFAVDYLENDAFHLATMGVRIDELREKMIGLRGRCQVDQYGFYCQDMATVLDECRRVLKPGGFCTIVVGTNNNQLSKILNTTPDRVRGIHESLTDLAECRGFRNVRRLERQITGMANTMRTEYILFLVRE